MKSIGSKRRQAVEQIENRWKIKHGIGGGSPGTRGLGPWGFGCAMHFRLPGRLHGRVFFPDSFRLVVLVDQFAAGAPPFGETSQLTALDPDTVGGTTIQDDTAATAEIEMAHPFAADRAGTVHDLPLVAIVSGDLIELHGVQPDKRVGLRFEHGFELTRVKKNPVTGEAALDSEVWFRTQFEDVHWNSAFGTGDGRVLAQVAKVNLTEINVGPHAAERAERHRSLEPSATTSAFHGAKKYARP